MMAIALVIAGAAVYCAALIGSEVSNTEITRWCKQVFLIYTILGMFFYLLEAMEKLQ